MRVWRGTRSAAATAGGQGGCSHALRTPKATLARPLLVGGAFLAASPRASSSASATPRTSGTLSRPACRCVRLRMGSRAADGSPRVRGVRWLPAGVAGGACAPLGAVPLQTAYRCHCGVQVGVAAAFNAPIGGLLFAFEEVASFWQHSLGWQVRVHCLRRWHSIHVRVGGSVERAAAMRCAAAQLHVALAHALVHFAPNRHAGLLRVHVRHAGAQPEQERHLGHQRPRALWLVRQGGRFRGACERCLAACVLGCVPDDL